jgi:starch synthase
MKKAKVLFVSQEITPFLPETVVSTIARNLPYGIQECGKEIRVFMPKYGCINERRHQLHEVIRLSGMNLIIDDADHPLIIKVASIPAGRMQVYFIDNEEYFQRKSVLADASGEFFKDNDERSMFFCKGVLETVKKLGWSPDIIHCHGWMTALMPLLVRKNYADDPHFADSKVVYSVYGDGYPGTLDKKLVNKMLMEGFEADEVKVLESPSYKNLNKAAIQFADGVIKGSETIDKEVEGYINETEKPFLTYQSPEEYVKAYDEFYDSILEESSVLAD